MNWTFKDKLFLTIYLVSYASKSALSQDEVACVEENLASPFLQVSDVHSFPSEMTVASCCKTCREAEYLYCGLGEGQFCYCTNETPVNSGTCSAVCSTDSKNCGSNDFGDLTSIYSSALISDPQITMSLATDPMTITMNFNDPEQRFSIDFSDGSPLVDVFPDAAAVAATSIGVPQPVTVSSPAFVIPGSYNVTVVSYYTDASTIVHSMEQTAVDGVAASEIIECPVVMEPDVTFSCIVSLTPTRPDLPLQAEFTNPVAINPASGIGNTYRRIGNVPPRGDAGEIADDTASSATVIKKTSDPIGKKSNLIAVELLAAEPGDFNVKILTPSCSGADKVCPYHGACQATCPFDSETQEFSCPNILFSNYLKCGDDQKNFITGGALTQTAVDLGTLTATSANEFLQLKPDPPVELLPGTILQVTGALAKSRQAGIVGDTVDDVKTTDSYFASMTVLEFDPVKVFHTCKLVSQNSDLVIKDTNVPPYAGQPTSVACQRIIQNVTLDIDQAETDQFNATINAENPYYVWSGYDYKLNQIVEVAGPMTVDITFDGTTESPVEYLDDYPLGTEPHTIEVTRQITTPGTYDLKISAHNLHNAQVNETTGVAPGPVEASLTVIAEAPVSPDWIMTSLKPIFRVPSEVPTVEFSDTAGWAFPTDAIVNMDWGDEMTEELKFEDPGDGKPKLTHAYTKDGIYNIIGSIKNNVSGKIDIPLTMTIYEDIIGFDVDIVYYDDPPTVANPMIDGYMVPVINNETFIPSMTQGTVEEYILTYTVNSSLIETYTVSDKFEPIMEMLAYFGYVELFNVTMEAKNSLESKTIDLFFEKISKVKGLRIDDFAIMTEYGEEKILSYTFAVAGGPSCLVIDHGDGTPPVAKGTEVVCQTNFTHAQFNEEAAIITKNNFTYTYNPPAGEVVPELYFKEFTISAFGFNDLSYTSNTFTLVVTNIDCNPPKTQIIGASTYYEKAKQSIKSLEIILTTKTEVNCALTSNTSKTWEIFKVDLEFNGMELGNAFMDGVSSWIGPTLAILPGKLDYGAYKAVYTVKMEDSEKLQPDWNFRAKAEHYFEIVYSPLIPKISNPPFSRTNLGRTQTVVLNAIEHSIDPDNVDLSMEVTWRCISEGETLTDIASVYDPRGTTSTGCFGYGPGVVTVEVNEWLLYGEFFRTYPLTYEIEAEISKGNRTASTKVIIDVTEEESVQFEVLCVPEAACSVDPESGKVFINADEPLKMMSICASECASNLTADWTVISNGTTIPFEVAEGGDSMGATIDSEFLNSLPPGEATLRVELTDPENPAITGLKEILFDINSPPVPGNCSLDPMSGTVLVTPFKLTCEGWTDNGEVSKYTVKASVGGSTSTLMNQMHGLDPQEVDLSLPAGDVSLQIHVIDQLGAETIFSINNILVEMLSEDELADMNMLETLDKLEGEGKREEVAMQLINYADAVKQAEWLNSGEPIPEETLLGLNDVLTKGIDSVSQMNPRSVGEVEAILGANAAVMGLAAESPELSKSMDLFTRGASADSVTGAFDTLRTMEISSTETVMNLATLHSEYTMSYAKSAGYAYTGNLAPRDFENADKMEYDTGLKVNDTLQEIPATVNLTKMENIGDLGFQQAEEKIGKLLSEWQFLTEKLAPTMLVGDSQNLTTDNGVSALILKTRAGGIKGKFCSGGSCVEFPDGLPNDLPDPNGIVTLRLLNMPVRTYLSEKTADLVNNCSSSFDVELYDEMVKTIRISEAKDKINLMLGSCNQTDQDNSMNKVVPREEYSWRSFPILYTSVKVEKKGSGIAVIFKPEIYSSDLFLIFDTVRLPTLRNYTDIQNARDFIKTNDTYAWYINSELLGTTNQMYIGVGQFTREITTSQRLNPRASSPGNSWLTNVTTNYEINVKTMACYFFDKEQPNWSSTNIKTMRLNDDNQVVCSTNHLTTFASGLFVAANTIDFSYVFANMGFLDNVTIYVTLIVTACVFAVLLIWAWYQDRRDVEKIGAIPLPDNQPDEKYLYEILVFTGSRREAQTDSTVQFVLMGEKEETEIRTFGSTEKPIFRKGGVDVFVMSVSRHLGPLQFIRIWHDNTGEGPNASWYLSYMVFRDVQTGDKFEFIANDWLALEKSDGLVEKMFPAAGSKDKKSFSHLFQNTSSKNLASGHLWFSIFLRPPRSRFTRCQRVGCAFAFLFLSMLVNAMWYDVVPESPSTGGLKFGSFRLTTAELGIGLMSNLIVFLPSLLIVFLFQKSRPRNLRKSRIETALEKASNIESDEEETLTEREPIPNRRLKKKRFTLPWWCRWVSWVLVGACIGASLFFLLAYGIMFGNSKATKWVLSLFMSFLSSVLLLQPLKVILMAYFLSAICKTSHIDEDDADEDEQDPNLERDEIWTFPPGERVGNLSAHEMDVDDVEHLRSSRISDVDSWSLIRELFIYLSFIWILLVLAYSHRGSNGWLLQNSLRNAFIHDGANDGTDYNKVANAEMLWQYIYDGFMPELRADLMYNGKPPLQLRGFLNDYCNRIISHGIIRQIRVKKNSCRIHSSMVGTAEECAGATQITNEESRDYCVGWELMTEKNANSSRCRSPEFWYSSASQLRSLSIWGPSDWYSGGGYVIHLAGRTTPLREKLLQLHKDKWIDRHTRAVLIEFATYNSQVNMFGMATIFAEFTPGGGIRPSYRFDAISLLQSENEYFLFTLVCELLFVIFTVFFTVKEFRLIWKKKCRYFDSYWSYAELSVIFASYIVITLYFLKMEETNRVLEIFDRTYGNQYVRLTYAATMDEMYGYLTAFLVFVGTIKFIKLLRFNKIMGVLSSTLHQCWDDLSGFLMAFVICFFAFVQLFFFLLSHTIAGFNNIVTATETCFSMMMGKFQFQEMVEVSPLVPVLFFCFVLCTSWVLINLLLTIIIKSFQKVKSDLKEQPNEYEMLKFLKTRANMAVGRQDRNSDFRKNRTPANKAPKSRKNSSVQELPEKFDKFMAHINRTFFDGKLKENDKSYFQQANLY